MEQLNLKLSNPRKINVDGVAGVFKEDYSEAHIFYIGMATQQFDGTWLALANVFGTLCVVEVTITETKST